MSPLKNGCHTNNNQAGSHENLMLGVCIPSPEAFRDPPKDSNQQRLNGILNKNLATVNCKDTFTTFSTPPHLLRGKSLQEEQDQEMDHNLDNNSGNTILRQKPTTSDDDDQGINRSSTETEISSPSTSSTPSPPMFSATLTCAPPAKQSLPYSLPTQQLILRHHDLRERRARSTNADYSPGLLGSFGSNDNNNNCHEENVVTKYPSLRSLVTPPPTPSSSHNFPMNGVSAASSSLLLNQIRRLSKNGETRGSSASLLSASSNFSVKELLVLYLH